MTPWEKDQIISGGQPPWEKDSEVQSDAKSAAPYVVDALSGFYEGVGNIAGAPGDVSNVILSKVGMGSEKPFFGSDWIKDKMGKIRLIHPQQTTTSLGRGVRRVGQEVGAATLPSAGMLKVATTTAPVYQSSKTMIRKLFLDPIKASPGKATAGELIAATGAGAGAAVAKEKFPESKLAETTGQVVGGAAPSLAVFSTPGVAYKITRAIVSRFSKKSQQKAALKIVKESIGTELTRTAGESLKKIQRVKKKMSDKGIDFQPSVGEATGSPVLLRQQSDLEDKATGAFLEKITKRRIENQKAIDSYSKKIAPQSDFDAEFVIDSANKTVVAVGDEIDALVGREIQKKKDITNNIATIDRIQSGAAIRDGIQKARAEASIAMTLRAKELGLADENMSEAFNLFKEEIKQKYKPSSRFEDSRALPGIYREIIKDGKKTSQAILDDRGRPIKQEVSTTFKDIKTIRERLSDDVINELSSATPNRKKLRILMMMKKDVDSFLETAGGSLGEKYRQFREEYFNNYIKPFESGAVFKAKNKDGTGFFRTNDEHVASLFLNNPSAAKQFFGIFSGDPKMLKSFEAAALDDLKRFALDEGVLDSKKIKQWVKKMGESLEELPTIKDAVENVSSLQKKIDERQIRLFARKKKIEDMSLVKQLTRYGKNETTAENIIDDALKKPMKMERLKNFLSKNNDALSALKRAVWDKITTGNSGDIVSFMTKNDKALAVLFKKSHLRDMYDISLLKATQESIKKPSGKALSDTDLPILLKKVEEITGMKIPQYGTRLYAFKSGRVPKHYLLAEMAMSTLRQAGRLHADEIWKEALYDIDVSKSLANAVFDGKPTQKTANKIGGRLPALGIPYLREESPSKTEDKKEAKWTGYLKDSPR